MINEEKLKEYLESGKFKVKCAECNLDKEVTLDIEHEYGEMGSILGSWPIFWPEPECFGRIRNERPERPSGMRIKPNGLFRYNCHNAKECKEPAEYIMNDGRYLCAGCFQPMHIMDDWEPEFTQVTQEIIDSDEYTAMELERFRENCPFQSEEPWWREEPAEVLSKSAERKKILKEFFGKREMRVTYE